MKKLLLAVLVLVGGLVAFRRFKAADDERALWHEATTTPDLR